PVLAGTTLEVLDAGGQPSPRRISDVLPDALPDLFDGDQLVLLGRYHGSEPLTFRLGGNYLGRQRTFRFRFEVDKATTQNAFVPRLWASRKIAELVHAIRQHGANGDLQTLTASTADPKVKELADEILRMTTEFGILTEYTAFLAREGTDLTRRDDVLAEAVRNFESRAVQTRSGLASVNQSINGQYQLQQSCVNLRNGYYDAGMQRVAIATVQQVNDRAFFRRGNQWVDGQLIGNEEPKEPERTVKFGSPEFRALAETLAAQNRQ
ncbi:MAG: hypothetical protein ACREJB_00455, partial [Planctomycetaceae bacterium]